MLLAASSSTFVSSAWAQAASQGRSFAIEEQSVSSALRAFARQGDIQLIFSEQDTHGFNSSGVTGRLSPQDALAQLLRGTPLEFEFTTSGVAVVRKPRVVANRPGTQARAPEPTLEAPARHLDIEDLDEVTVTGSRIVRRDYEAASPILTVERRMFEQSSTIGIESVLNQLPQFVPASTQFLTNDVFPSAMNTPGTATLNLRGLATNRTLVLIDGRRAQPANSMLVIDMNAIPATAIDKVEIITGGASATYGADAMSGVTNFKLRDRFEGATLEARGGVTEAGDGAETQVSTLFGANVADGRGNVMFGLEWTRRNEAGLFGRPFFEDSLTDPGAPTTAIRIDYSGYEPNASAGGLPSQGAVNALFPQRPAGTNVNRATFFYLNRDGTLFKDAGALGYKGELNEKFKLQPNGVLGENNLAELVSSPMDRYSLLGRAHYSLTEDTRLIGQAMFASTEVRSVAQAAGANGGFAASIPRDADHPVSAQLAALLDSRGANVYSTTEFDPETGSPIVLTGVDANWRLGRPLDFLPPRQLKSASSVFQVLIGLEGELPLRDWTWETYATHGESRTDNSYIGFASLERYRAVVQSPNYGKGFSQTGAGQAQATCTSGLPIFEQFQVSQDCIDAITIEAADRTRLTQEVIEANLQGAVWDLPAGELRSALGASYRRNEFEFRPDATRETNSIIDIPISTFTAANTIGSTYVGEVYGELLIPLLRDKRLADSLELELGGRYSRYDESGNVPTYKALFSWAPVKSLRFRGGFQLANRAPNTNELFLSSSNSLVTMRGPEPCRIDTRDANGNRADNPNRKQVQELCSAIIGTGTSTFDDSPDTFIADGRPDGGEVERRSGNPDVNSEKGRTWTLGAVYRSPFEHALARRFTLAVDWYHARITGAITQISAQTTYDLCFNRDGMSNPSYSLDDPNGMCRRIVRDPVTGNRNYVNSTFLNVATLETSGIDAQASWSFDPAELGFRKVPGTLSLDILFNRLLDFGVQSFPTSPVLDNAGTFAREGLFDYRALTTLRYSAFGADVSFTWRRLPSIRNEVYATDPLTPFAGARSYNLFNLAASWNINSTVRVTAGIDNLFDRDPNRVGAGPNNNGAGNTEPGSYDVLGRRYYGGLRLSF